jgi:hypothetical protein
VYRLTGCDGWPDPSQCSTVGGEKHLKAFQKQNISIHAPREGCDETVRREITYVFQNQANAKTLIDSRGTFSFGTLDRMVREEERTGFISEAQKKRRKR